MARTGAFLWMACLQFFLAEQIVRLRWTVPYSFSRNYVSDLGATVCTALLCSPWHELMNASFVLQGLLIAGGAILTWKQWNVPGRIGMGLLVVCGAGVIVVGFVPEDGDNALHRLAAAFHFLGGGLGMIAAAFGARGWFRWICMATGVAVLAATVAIGLGGGVWVEAIGIGALERVAAYGIAGWMLLLGAYSVPRPTSNFP